MDNLFGSGNVLENLYEGVYCVDLDRKIVFWNRGAERITGYAAAEVLDSSCADNILVHTDEKGKHLCNANCPLAGVLGSGDHHAENCIYLHHKDGHRVPVSVSVSSIRDARGKIIGAVEIFREHSAGAYDEKYIEDLRRAALLDPLTGIPNRRYAEIKLRAAFEERRRHGTSFAVLLIDVDHFKKINDTYGHDTGDRVLKMISKTMTGMMRAYNIVGRWGGEEFIAIVSHINRDGLQTLACQMRALVENSFLTHEGAAINATVTIGASIALPEDSVQSLLKRADGLLYKGKGLGRNCVVIEEKLIARSL